jgi:crotonobetainyl-CoA:carnitine CoA-transferase CaiB-like acyl-CoA transferase
MNTPVTGQLTLEGVRVLDLTWVYAGPVCTQLLADQGAEVIKLESERSMDVGRVGGPWLHDTNTSPDGGGGFTRLNRNKRAITLNLKTPEGNRLFKELVAQSDVLVNNYMAGTLKRMGLGWDVLRDVNPRLIMCECSGMGQTGPYSGHVAYGQSLLALAGHYELTGYPDSHPVMPAYTYADFASPTIAAFAVTSALIWRKQSGVGQYIDLSQFEVTASLLAEAQFEYLINGAERTREGNAEPGCLVHNVFRCAGNDAWCAIVIRTPAEWSAFCAIAGDSRLPASLEPAGDTSHIESIIEEWTVTRSSAEVMETLQAAGIEAGRVQNTADIVDGDEHVQQRGYFETYEHLLGEQVRVDGVPFKMSLTPAHVRKPGPTYGGDNDYIFGEMLGLSAERINELRQSGVIG